jgi:hypothetical protein
MFHDILDDYVMDVQGLFNAYNLNKTPEEIEAELNGRGTAKGSSTAAPETEQEDDDEMFGDADLGTVSKATVDDIGRGEVDDIMSSWN